MAHEKSIYIKGARVHNLKNIEVEIPHEKLVVGTGLSGSGKSTLAFDTIFAEGQRRYVESLSAYARQFLGKINKPDVDIITGIAPAIAIEQKVNTRNPRSTVGTTTEIYDYLKLLYARIGHTFSPVSGEEVRCFSVDDVAAWILAHADQRVVIGAPLALAEGQGIIEKLTLLLSEGLMRVYMDGEVKLIEDVLPGIGPDTDPAGIKMVIDRMRVATDEDSQTRIRDSVARAFSYGGGVCEVVTDEGIREFSSRFEADGIEFEHPSEHLFSFNNPLGACPRCEGYGYDNEATQARLKVMTKTNDGFKISEEDLKLRGPGDFFGSRQHGLPAMHVADLGSDMNVLQEAQDAAHETLASDPELSRPEHAQLKAAVARLFTLNADTLN